MDFIFIEELRVDAHVGIYPREQVAAQTIEINLTFGVPDEAAQDDDIAKTIDYAEGHRAHTSRVVRAAIQSAGDAGRIRHRADARRLQSAVGKNIDSENRGDEGREARRRTNRTRAKRQPEIKTGTPQSARLLNQLPEISCDTPTRRAK